MKKVISVFITVCVLFALTLSVGASEYLPLFDEPDVMTDAEESALITSV